MKNKSYALYNLKEMQQDLIRIIKDIETNSEYANEEFAVDVTQLYHHLNTAWNAKDASAERTEKCSESDYELWRQFPSKEDLHL